MAPSNEHNKATTDADLSSGKAKKILSIKPPIPESSKKQASNPHNEYSRESVMQTATAPAPALDIFAAKYVPRYQIAANESFAVVHPAPALPTIDYDAYIATFAGSQLVKPCPSIDLSESVIHQSLNNQLTSTCYTSYWCDRLRSESAAQAAQHYNLTLFNVRLEKHGLDGSLFKLKVPGLRESTPRLDLADTVVIRPLLAVLHGHIERLVKQWYEQADFSIISPGFSGQEYHAVVWYVSRRDETIVIKGPLGMNGLHLQCNVLFPVSVSKHEPFIRSVTAAGKALSGETSNSWLHAILFPELSNGAVQNKLSTGTFKLKWFDNGLNFEQKKAIQAVKDNRYGNVPYIISGPPGTGKTRTLVELAMQMLTTSTSEGLTPHILVCAPSDAAADTLLMRLSKYLSINEVLRLNNWTRASSEVPGEVLPYCYQNSSNLFALPDFRKLMSYKVVVTSCRDADMLVRGRLTNDLLASLVADMLTTISPTTRIDHSKLVHWTALLLDEAAQATEPEALIPISVVMPSLVSEWTNSTTVQLIMAGDEYQLGPRLTPQTFSLNSDKALSISLFARLSTRPLYADHPLARSQGSKPLTASMLPIIRPPFTNLIRNYRSHPAILAVPSTLFYADTLIPEHNQISPSIMTWPEWPKQDWPVLFHNCSSPDTIANITEGDGTGAGSLTNHAEARFALHYAQSLLQHTRSVQYAVKTTDMPREKDIIVLSPFRAQVALLRTVFRAHGLYEINIGPLEAFQGLEARIVIICTTRTRLAKVVDTQIARSSQPQTRTHAEKQTNPQVSPKSHKETQIPSQAYAETEIESHTKTPPRLSNLKPNPIATDLTHNLGLIDEPNRFNVALTRARDGLLVLGHAACLTSTRDYCWTSFLAFCTRNGLLRSEEIDSPSLSETTELAGRLEGTEGSRFVQRLGGLEKALRYADFLASSESGRDSGKQRNGTDTHTGDEFEGENGAARRFILRGRMIGLDEEMEMGNMALSVDRNGNEDADADADEEVNSSEEEEEYGYDDRAGD